MVGLSVPGVELCDVACHCSEDSNKAAPLLIVTHVVVLNQLGEKIDPDSLS